LLLHALENEWAAKVMVTDFVKIPLLVAMGGMVDEH
jgi:hypothetical protein